MVSFSNELMKFKLEQLSNAVRSRIDRGAVNETGWYSQTLELKLDVMEGQRHITACRQQALEETLCVLREHLREKLAQEKEREKQLEDVEKNLKILCDSEAHTGFSLTELEESMSR